MPALPISMKTPGRFRQGHQSQPSPAGKHQTGIQHNVSEHAQKACHHAHDRGLIEEVGQKRRKNIGQPDDQAGQTAPFNQSSPWIASG